MNNISCSTNYKISSLMNGNNRNDKGKIASDADIMGYVA